MKRDEAIQKLRMVLRRQHKALSTEQSYCGWLSRYMAAVGQMPASLTSEHKLERFLTDLALANISASTQNQAFNAIVFFYKEVLLAPLKNVDALRASRPAHVRHAPTVEETFLLLNQVRNVAGYPTNLIARLLYGCGLRVTEPLNLRVKDVREDRLFIMGAKGRKDRVVSLPDSIMLDVRGQLDFAKAIWTRDCQAKIPVEMPEGLARKYPEYRFAWGWAWVFPSHRPCRHPRTQEWVRWRCHESNVQRAIKAARRELGIMVLPHELRHAYATHCLDRGTNIKALQEAMGHAQVETTMGYCHADALSVRSPLEIPAINHQPSVQYATGSDIEIPTGSYIDLEEEAGLTEQNRRDFIEEIARPRPPPNAGSHIAIYEPEIPVLEIKNSDLMSSGSDIEGTQLKGREKALFEEACTQRAGSVSANYRHDGYLMEKLERHPGLRRELLDGKTPTARKFAVLYRRDPDQARELLGTAVKMPGNPNAYLNTRVKDVRY